MVYIFVTDFDRCL